MARVTNGTIAARHKQRLALYRQGLTDSQIAARVGVTLRTIAAWRSKHGLRFNPSKRGYGGVPMSEVLTPDQQETARLGLRIISTAYKHGASISEALSLARKYIGDGRIAIRG